MSRRGFNLLETVMAVGLFAVMALSILSLFVSSRTAGENGFASAQASGLGSGELSRARTLPYNTLVGYLTSPLPAYSVTEEGTTYQVQLTVARVGANPAQPDYALLDLQVGLSWTQKGSLQTENAAAREVVRRLSCHTVVGPSASL